MGNVDVHKLKLFLDNDYKNKVSSNITDFYDVDMIYKWTNEKMKLYPKENLENKKILTITSSADHALDTILSGAKQIDSIDINIFCKYYSALKIAMIKKYNYDEFFEKINIFTNEMSTTSKYEILNEVSIYLTGEELHFWNTYLSMMNFFSPSFFNNYPNSPVNNKYINKEEYKTLKEKIKDVKITYYDGDIINIDEILKNKKYDYMYLSNILENVICCFENENKNKYNTKELIGKLFNHLNEKGCIYNYFLGLKEMKINDLIEIYFKDLKEQIEFIYYGENNDINSSNGVLVLRKSNN